MKERRINIDDIDIRILWELSEEELTPYRMSRKLKFLNKPREFFKYRFKKLEDLGWITGTDDGVKGSRKLNEENALADEDTLFLKSVDGNIFVVPKRGSETGKKLPEIMEKLGK